MKNSKTFKDHRNCECTDLPFLPNEWIYTECPFAPKPERARQKEQSSIDFYKTLLCPCGKEVGEIQFSGHEPGKWRVFEQKTVAEEKLGKFREYMQSEAFKEMLATLQKMGRIEKAVFFASYMYERMA